MSSLGRALIWISCSALAVACFLVMVVTCLWFHRFPTEIEFLRLAVTILVAIVIDKCFRS
jgi:hypothetical protein